MGILQVGAMLRSAPENRKALAPATPGAGREGRSSYTAERTRGAVAHGPRRDQRRGASSVKNVCRALALVAALVTAPPVSAQPAAPAGPAATELPTMVMKVCPKLEDAKSQADLSAQFAKAQAPVAIEPRYLWQGCSAIPIIARLRTEEPSIKPFETWAVTYDPKSTTFIDAKHAGATHKVPYSIRRQRVKYFSGEFIIPPDVDDTRIHADDRGKWYAGWIEVPDEPYLSKFLQSRKP
jgi:hypothetical protein